MIFSYFDAFEESLEFLMALGSIVGMIGFIAGLFGMLFLGQFNRSKMGKVIIISIILLAVCGFNTGMAYFRI